METKAKTDTAKLIVRTDMDRSGRKILSIMLSLAVAFTMIPWSAIEAFAEDSGDTYGPDMQAYYDEDESELEQIARALYGDQPDPYAEYDWSGDSSLRRRSAYPSVFDLRNVDGRSYVTPVKFQAPWGTCWAFSMIAAAETDILGNGTLSGGLDSRSMDLSEKHLAWFAFEPVDEAGNPQNGEGMYYIGEGSQIGYGGFYPIAISTFEMGSGPVLESLDESLGYHGKKRWIRCSDDKNYNENEVPSTVRKYHYSEDDDWSIDKRFKSAQSFGLKEAYILPNPPEQKTDSAKTAAINAIKQEIYNKRAVSIGIKAKGSFMSDNWAYYTYDKDAEGGHAVTIVGWNDNYKKENFTHLIKDSTLSNAEQRKLTTPRSDGAWLVKNSYGSETEEFPDCGYGDYGIENEKGQNTGYFWLSYEDLGMDNPTVMEFDNTTAENGYKTYQHSYMPVLSPLLTADTAYLDYEVRTANIFTAGEKLRIEKVSFETADPDTKVHCEVYALKDNAAGPQDGTKVADMTRVYKYTGFHKEDLTGTLPVIEKGKRFSVVITEQSPDNRYYVIRKVGIKKEDAEAYGWDVYFKGVINNGESMLWKKGKWLDMANKDNQWWLYPADWSTMDNFTIRAYTTEVDDPAPSVTDGMTAAVDGGTVRVTSASAGTVSFASASNGIKSLNIPASYNLYGREFTVTGIDKGAFRGKAVRTLTVRSKFLTKKSVKGSLKSSKVKTVKVKVGSKKENKKYVKKYKKIFTKKNAGKKVKVK